MCARGETMKIMPILFVLTAVALVVFVDYDLSERVTPIVQNQAAIEKREKAEQQALAAARQAELDSSAEAQAAKFITRFRAEAQQLAGQTANTEIAEARLQALAAQMGQSEVRALYDVISDDRNSSDERALAVELLSIKNDTASLMALQNFVASDSTTTGKKWDRQKELETVLRAQAVESIAGYPEKQIALSTLNYLQSKVDEKFLIDRIGRATSSLTGQSFQPSQQQQNEDALRNLIE